MAEVFMAEVLWQMKLSPKKVMSLEANYFIKRYDLRDELFYKKL